MPDPKRPKVNAHMTRVPLTTVAGRVWGGECRKEGTGTLANELDDTASQHP